MVRFALLGPLVSLFLAACCSVPQTTAVATPTAFTAELISVGDSSVTVMPSTHSRPLTLILAGPEVASLSVGSTVYVQGELTQNDQVVVTALQVVAK